MPYSNNKTERFFLMKSKFCINVLVLCFLSFSFAVPGRKKSKVSFQDIKEDIKAKKYKYAIFDIQQSFWKHSLKDVLDLYYEKKKSEFGWWKRTKMFGTIAKLGTQYLFGTIDPKSSFEDFLSYFKGTYQYKLKEDCRRVWVEDCKDSIYRRADELFRLCEKHGIKTILADVAMQEFFSFGLLDVYDFDYVCATELEYDDCMKITGKIKGNVCTKDGKLERVKNVIEKKLKGSLKDAIFFANSHYDIPILEAVGCPVVVNPVGSKIEKSAKKNKWPILKFKKLVSAE